MRPPKKWKWAILIWLAIYPLTTAIFAVLGKYILTIQFLPLRTLIVTVVEVPIMVYILLPILQKSLAGWLKNDSPKNGNS
jgi:antibiotic biosynthesis monooxygenase (ABM) superfamily enzyme